MAHRTHDFGAVERLSANAVGLPGQRTFRLRFTNENDDSASLWIEKEELLALGSAVDQVIAQLSDDPFIDLISRREPEPEPQVEPVFPEPPSIEFKIGRLALAPEGDGRFTLLVHDIEDQSPGAPPNFRCQVTDEQLQSLSGQIEAVVNAGRPRCPLCGTPLSTGVAHFCPPSNGHTPVRIEE